MDVTGATAGGALRWSRALALAAVALLTAVLAHVAAGEPVPAAGSLAVLLAVVTCAAGPLLRHPASTRRVVLLLTGGEAFIHFALVSMSSGPGHSMTGMHHGETGVSMTAAHLAAAMAVGLWLAAGERALWALLCLAVQPLTCAVAVLRGVYDRLRLHPGEVSPAPRVHREERRPVLAARACEVVARRGPPGGSLRLLGI